MYMAGCVSDSFYPILKKFVDSLKWKNSKYFKKILDK
jgi:hypothetical protein